MIVDKIFEHARTQPGRTAFIENDIPFTYAAFAGLIATVRRTLEAERLPVGAFAAAMGNSFIEQWVITLALRSFGLNTFIIRDLQTLKGLKIKNVACIAATRTSIARLASGSGSLDAGVGLVAIPQPLRPLPLAEMNSPAAHAGHVPEGGFVAWTSGTTGHFKKTFATAAQFEMAVPLSIESSGFDKDTVFHALHFPPWTAIGATTPPFIWWIGGCVIMDSTKNPWANYFLHHPTVGMLPPALLPGFLAAQPEAAPLREDFTLHVAGGFLPLALAEALVHRITPELYIGYGSTEAPSSSLRSKFETAEDLHWLKEHHVSRFEIVDERGEICPAGVEGEIRVRLRESDCQSYLDDEEATAKFFRNGCFYPGDLAVRRADGRIRILGRVDDVVNLGGFKVAAAPLENEIGRRVGSNAVCLFAKHDPQGVEQVVVAIEADHPPPADEIKKILAGRRGFERVRIATLKSFPRTDEQGLRKVDRRALNRMLD